MVISKIQGGLGNQMFQYAAARALSLKNATSLLLDTSFYEQTVSHQGFELNKLFALGLTELSHKEVKSLLGLARHPLVRKLSYLSSLYYAKEPCFSFWKGIDNIKGDAYLDGYWQSERYFLEYEDVIRRDFQFSSTLFLDEDVKLKQQINDCSSVSIHVRRGDYLSQGAISYHGVCPVSYYEDAVTYICSLVESPVFFVFSDDVDWVKSSFNFLNNASVIYVDKNTGFSSFKDMFFMSICKHNIIANSTFSWWGAWLNRYSAKTVIAPKNWFADVNMQKQTDDLYPESWVCL